MALIAMDNALTEGGLRTAGVVRTAWMVIHSSCNRALFI